VVQPNPGSGSRQHFTHFNNPQVARQRVCFFYVFFAFFAVIRLLPLSSCLVFFRAFRVFRG
jgi:hypothetical protein